MKKFAQRPYHAMSSSATLLHLQSTEKGLSDFDASGRVSFFGKNALPVQKKISGLFLFLKQFHNPLIYVVVVASVVSFGIGHELDAFFILLVICVNALFGFMQEYKAEHALEKLKGTMQQYVRVIRGGQKKKILAENVAVGDVIDVIAGDRVVADGRVINVNGLYVNESVLTGEWQEIQKKEDILDENIQLPDQKNMIFAGTTVMQGHGIYVVTATGSDTEIGKISQFVKSVSVVQTPLQRKFSQLSLVIGSAIFAAIAVFAVIGIMRQQTFSDIFTTSTALAVGAIPEGLLPAITIVLIFGMRRLAGRYALVRKLNASETMGAITVICTDKTGTLTQGAMAVSHILTGANELLDFKGVQVKKRNRQRDLIGHVKALRIAAMVNDAYIENLTDPMIAPIVHGRPTDRALLLAAMQLDIDVEGYRAQHRLIDQVFFTSESKYAVRVYELDQDKVQIMLLGAPEEILHRVAFIDVHGVRMPFNSDEGRRLMDTFEELTGKGLRVLACGERILTKDTYERLSQEDRYNTISLVGYIALKDPLRADVEESLRVAERAGIRLVMITGDHAATAQSVMAELGHLVSHQGSCIGKDIDSLSEGELKKLVQHTKIFARVLPEHKIRIVRALQSNGEIVAMVGDGINDAPALRASDVGISIGEGADVAREVSDIVLLDSSFSTIIKSIEQGRVIYENIRRILIYLVADNFSVLFVFFWSIVFGWPLPLLAVQILWINVIEDSFPNIALTTEYDSKNLMNEPPRKPDEPIISHAYKKFITIVFVVSGVAATAIFWMTHVITQDLALARTATFALIAFDSLIFVYVIRSMRQSVFRKNIFNNVKINMAVSISLLLLLAGIYLPFFAHVLGTVSLNLSMWSVILAITLIELMIFEISKHMLLIKQR